MSNVTKWLERGNINFIDDLRKTEFYELIRLHKPPLVTYEIYKKHPRKEIKLFVNHYTIITTTQ